MFWKFHHHKFSLRRGRAGNIIVVFPYTVLVYILRIFQICFVYVDIYIYCVCARVYTQLYSTIVVAVVPLRLVSMCHLSLATKWQVRRQLRHFLLVLLWDGGERNPTYHSGHRGEGDKRQPREKKKTRSEWKESEGDGESDAPLLPLQNNSSSPRGSRGGMRRRAAVVLRGSGS